MIILNKIIANMGMNKNQNACKTRPSLGSWRARSMVPAGPPPALRVASWPGLPSLKNFGALVRVTMTIDEKRGQCPIVRF